MAIHTSGCRGIQATATVRARWQALRPNRPPPRHLVRGAATLRPHSPRVEAHPAGRRAPSAVVGVVGRAGPDGDPDEPDEPEGDDAPRALVHLSDGSVFAAWRIARDRHLVTAYGRFRHRVGLRHERRFRFTCWQTRSWPLRRIEEVHWLADPWEAAA